MADLLFKFPATSSADLLFGATGTPVTDVSGWLAASFGVPSVRLPVTGWKATGFGTPVLAFAQFGTASGFKPINFGRPFVFNTADGFMPASFGTPDLLPHAVGFKAASFGTPTSIQYRASGFMPVSFGIAGVITRNRVPTWRPTHFGTPTVPTNRACVASGFFSVHFGSPVPIRSLSHTRRLLGRSLALRSVKFGTPTT